MSAYFSKRNKMKIRLDNIKEEGLQWQGDVNLDNDRLIGEAFCEKPASVKIEIYPVKNYFRMKGEMKGSSQLQCSRCLESYNKDFQIKFEEVIVKEPLSGEDYEKELSDEEMNFSFNHGDEIDLCDIITEQFLLTLSMKNLCSEECKGLCRFCGENLNNAACNCDLKQENIDPRFAALMELKKQSKS
jgi:uncharacterized protein